MSKRCCRGLRALACCLLLLTIAGQAYAAEPAEAVWNVPFIGRLTEPDGFMAVDFEKWLDDLQTSLSKDRAKKPETAAAPIARNALAMPEEIRLYQLQVNDGKVYHIAFAMVLRDSRGLFPGLAPYFAATPLTADQAKQLTEMNDKIRLGINLMQNYLEKTGVMTMRVLDLKPLERLREPHEVVYSLRGRVILDIQGMVYPFFTKGYVLERAGKGAIIVVLTTDAEGPFWEKTLDAMVNSLERTITFSTRLN